MGAWSLSHWTTKEVPVLTFSDSLLYAKCSSNVFIIFSVKSFEDYEVGAIISLKRTVRHRDDNSKHLVRVSCGLSKIIHVKVAFEYLRVLTSFTVDTKI